MNEAEARIVVRDIKQDSIDRGVQPVYLIDQLQADKGWSRAQGDVISWGVHHGTNTKGWRDYWSNAQ